MNLGLTPEEWRVVALSVRVALLALAVAFVPAVALARWLARGRGLLRAVVGGLVLLPLVLPPVVTGYLALLSFGRRSPLGQAWHALFGTHLSFSTSACVLAAVIVGFPLLVTSARLAFAAVDPRLEAVSRSLGHNRFATFRRVTLPLSAAGLVSGAILFTARALGEFGATIVLAGNMPGETRQIPLAVYTLLNQPGGEPRALRLAAFSALLSFAALLATAALSGSRRRAEVSGSPANNSQP